MVLVWLTNYKQQNFHQKKQTSQGTHELHRVISKLGTGTENNMSLTKLRGKLILVIYLPKN